VPAHFFGNLAVVLHRGSGVQNKGGLWENYKSAAISCCVTETVQTSAKVTIEHE